MRIGDILCSEDIADELATKHQVGVEEVLWNSPHIRFHERGKREGEDLYMAFGQTDEGRYLVVLFIKEAAGRKLLTVEAVAGQPPVKVCLITQDKWNQNYEQLDDEGASA